MEALSRGRFAPVYCDYNATAPLRPEARAAMCEAMELNANPSSVHGPGRRARAMMENARGRIADAVGACRDDLFFTSGGTESNAAVIGGAMAADATLCPIFSAIEHDAVRAQSPDAEITPVTRDGVLDLEWLKARMARWDGSQGRPFLALMLANNETGAIQPVAQAAELVHAAGGLVHCDAVQALGKIPVSVIDLDVDYMSLSGHKAGGPQGTGAVYLRAGAPFVSRLVGGGQEMGRRSGTENLIGIAGFAAAVDMALADLDGFQEMAQQLRVLENRLRKTANVTIFSENTQRLANTSCLAIEGFRSDTQVMAMDLAGVAISSGSACSSGKVRRSHVLQAMGVSDDKADAAIRLSFGWATQATDFERVADAWLSAARRAGVELSPEGPGAKSPNEENA